MHVFPGSIHTPSTLYQSNRGGSGSPERIRRRSWPQKIVDLALPCLGPASIAPWQRGNVVLVANRPGNRGRGGSAVGRQREFSKPQTNRTHYTDGDGRSRFKRRVVPPVIFHLNTRGKGGSCGVCLRLIVIHSACDSKLGRKLEPRTVISAGLGERPRLLPGLCPRGPTLRRVSNMLHGTTTSLLRSFRPQHFHPRQKPKPSPQAHQPRKG